MHPADLVQRMGSWNVTTTRLAQEQAIQLCVFFRRTIEAFLLSEITIQVFLHLSSA